MFGVAVGFGGPGDDQERRCGHGQGDVRIPGVVAADLVLVEATSFFAVWNDSSTAHLAPAVLTRVRSRVPRGPKHT